MASTTPYESNDPDLTEPLVGTVKSEKPVPPSGPCQPCKKALECFTRCFCKKQVFMALAIVSAIVLASVFNKQVTKELNIFMSYCKRHILVAPLLFAAVVASLTIVMMPTFTLF